MRPVVQAECTLKESAAINQILGRRVSQGKNGEYFSLEHANKFDKTLDLILIVLTFSSGTGYPVRSKLNIMRRLAWSASVTCSCTLTGTLGIIIDTEQRRRNGRETNPMIQVAAQRANK